MHGRLLVRTEGAGLCQLQSLPCWKVRSLIDWFFFLLFSSGDFDAGHDESIKVMMKMRKTSGWDWLSVTLFLSSYCRYCTIAFPSQTLMWITRSLSSFRRSRHTSQWLHSVLYLWAYRLPVLEGADWYGMSWQIYIYVYIYIHLTPIREV